LLCGVTEDEAAKLFPRVDPVPPVPKVKSGRLEKALVVGVLVVAAVIGGFFGTALGISVGAGVAPPGSFDLYRMVGGIAGAIVGAIAGAMMWIAVVILWRRYGEHLFARG
jgi:hypothetical protein